MNRKPKCQLPDWRGRLPGWSLLVTLRSFVPLCETNCLRRLQVKVVPGVGWDDGEGRVSWRLRGFV